MIENIMSRTSAKPGAEPDGWIGSGWPETGDNAVVDGTSSLHSSAF